MSEPSNVFLTIPPDISILQQIYGDANVHGMGSSVVCVTLHPTDTLEHIAKKRYQEFCGEIWDRFGPDNWLRQWEAVYHRPQGQMGNGNILEELRGLTDHPMDLCVSMLLDNVEDAEAGKVEMSRIFNARNIGQLSVYRLGDGEAFTGLLIAAVFSREGTQAQETNRQAVLLTFLMD
jgi:hypothetical protein